MQLLLLLPEQTVVVAQQPLPRVNSTSDLLSSDPR
jgi:hypothetical protein